MEVEPNYTKIIETVVVLVVYIILRKVFFKVIDRTLNERILQDSRGVAIKRVVQTLLLILCLIFIMIIWGVKQSDLTVFVGSILTVVGVAFFAQWSILSNITSSIILFFNHPTKIYDSIMILEGKDYVVEGKITNIGLFFVTLLTPEGEIVTLPNNIFIQKSIKKINPSRIEVEEEMKKGSADADEETNTRVG